MTGDGGRPNPATLRATSLSRVVWLPPAGETGVRRRAR
jgi:hypothetical protein